MYETLITLLKSVPNLLTKFDASLDSVCGDKCLGFRRKKCECGDTMFDQDNYLYCCIPMNETCKVQGMFLKAK